VAGRCGGITALSIHSPTQASSTLSNGNLDVVTASASYGKVNGTIAVSSGKWYWEVVCTVRNQDTFIGIEGVANANTDTYTGGSATGTGWYNGGTIYSNASTSSYGTTYAANDVIGVALDMDARDACVLQEWR